MRTLVLGGIRSGKSRWAEEAISTSLAPDQPVRYLAAGTPGGARLDGDADWALRVARHRERRPAHWTTAETEDVPGALRRAPAGPTLVDDLGRWLTAVLDRHHGWEDGSVPTAVRDEVDQLLCAVSDFGSDLMLVSPEVGLTVVPATASGRRFADELGSLNQRLAAVCDRAVLVVAGQALAIKPSAS